MFNHKEQQGFLTLAYNSENTNFDYLELAYVQAIGIKLSMPDARYCVVVDSKTYSKINNKHKHVFDYVIQAPESNWPMSLEPELFWLSPFKETIKLESDLLITKSVKHWWSALRLRPVVLSTNCKNIQGKTVIDNDYRKFWRDNQLPNVYNGLMYFRFTKEAFAFFTLAKNIFNNWGYLRDNVLINCREEKPSTDAVYAITAKIIGEEQCTMPSLDYFNFVHMKPHINNWTGTVNWNEVVLSEIDPPMIRINNLNQLDPVHYHIKNWITDDIIRKFELAAGIN